MHIADPHYKWRIERNEVKMGKLFSFDFDDGKYALRRSRAQSSKFITSAKSNKSATSSAQHHPHEVYRGENKDRNLITVNCRLHFGCEDSYSPHCIVWVWGAQENVDAVSKQSTEYWIQKSRRAATFHRSKCLKVATASHTANCVNMLWGRHLCPAQAASHSSLWRSS